MSKSVIRIVRNGRVKHSNRWYYATDKSSDGDGLPIGNTLDGIACLFHCQDDDLVLWGTACEAYGYSEEVNDFLWKHKPEVIDGVFHWQIWKPTDPPKENTNE